MKKTNLINLLIAILIAVTSGFSSYFGIFSSFDNTLMDIAYQKPDAINPQIKIIALDEKTLARAEDTAQENWGRYGTWSRGVYADLVNTLNQSSTIRPAVIGLDIMFFGQNTPEGDAELVEACKKYDNVVSASHFVFEDKLIQTSNNNYVLDRFNIGLYEEPYPELKAVTKQGFSNSTPDNDGVVRKAFHSIEYQNTNVNSLATECYEMYQDFVGRPSKKPAMTQNKEWFFPYSSTPQQYEHIPMIDVLDGKIPVQAFDDCIVLIGAYAPGLLDQFTTAIDKQTQMYGVEVHANIIEALIEGKSALPIANKYLLPLITAFICGGLYFLFRNIHIVFSTVILVVSSVGYIFFGQSMYGRGVILNLIYIPLFLIIAYLLSLIYHYLGEILKRRQVTAAFKKYVAPQVVDTISKSGQFNLELGGVARNIAVLFVDIRGFTPLSESLKPSEVVEILNSYLNLTTKSIFDNSGTLDKFIGDATMAVFNAPFDLEDYVFKAVCTAYDIAAGSNKLKQELFEKFGKTVSFGIGINCGEAIVGNVGCDFRMDYTAIGDTVNTAARLESNASSGQILISQAVYDIVHDRVSVDPIGEIPLKGKTQNIFVYSITSVEGKGNLQTLA